MKYHPSPKLVVLCVMFILLLSILACGFDFGRSDEAEEINLQQTIVSLQLTQAELEREEITEEEPTETPPTPTVTVEPPDISFEGISFSFDQTIARNINPAIVQGQNLGEEYMPGDTYPTHIEFSFDTYAVSDHFHEPKIIIYPVEEYRIINQNAATIIEKLQQTLIDEPGGSAMSNLPFLPMWPAQQMFSAKVEYFNFQNGSGLRFLTMYGQALYPIDNVNLFYTYQGITYDGRYYLCAVLPVINAGLPNDGSVLLEDYQAFIDNWDTYLTDSMAWLEAESPQNFLPNLEVLDAMMATFNINR